MIHDTLHIFLIVVFVYAAANVIYLLVAAIAGHLKKSNVYRISKNKKRIAVLITSYKEDEVILNTVRMASLHNYPANYFGVFVAADQLHPATLAALEKLPVQVARVEFETGSKARSLNHLLNTINEQDYDVALVLDADNVMHDDFLEKINAAFQQNFKAVQGHRTAKNKNTPVAILDAISEEINNHLFRKAQRAMGLSSALIGSGMAFEFRELKQVYNKPGILDNPACDREVDFEMMKAGVVVEYIDDAFIFDEKVSRRNVYENQRRRWLESQIIHLKLFFSKEHVPDKTKDYWNKLFINLIPPRLILIAFFICIFIIYSVFALLHFPEPSISVFAWLILFAVYVVAMLISIPRKLYTAKTLMAMASLPLLLFSLLKAVTGLRPGRKEFVHTPKSFTGEQDKNTQ